MSCSVIQRDVMSCKAMVCVCVHMGHAYNVHPRPESVVPPIHAMQLQGPKECQRDRERTWLFLVAGVAVAPHEACATHICLCFTNLKGGRLCDDFQCKSTQLWSRHVMWGRR